MKILCAYSSIEFTVEHFPGSLTSREAYHPVFNFPQRKLLGYLSKWSAGELTPTDSYLLFLALLRSSDLVSFRVPAVRTESTDQIIANNLEHLAIAVTKLNTVQNPQVHFPQYVISSDTKTLVNVEFWIKNWLEAHKEFAEGKSRAIDDRDEWKKLAIRQSALERLIKSKHRLVSSYSSQLADWAAVAGKFPEALTVSRFSGLKCSISDYWKQIIHKCAHDSQIFSINRQDLEELIEHCETEIPIGTIFSNLLFSILREAESKSKNFLQLGEIDLSKSTYQILSSSDSVEDANIRAMIQSAPETEPKQEDYPTKLAYFKAKSRYELAQKYKSQE